MRLLPLLVLPLIACANAGRVDTIVALEGDAANGATLYATTCAGCHGADGQGGSGPRATGRDAVEVASVILSGEEEMPAYADQFDDQEIADIIAWLDTQG
jgi:mono/diheme cytochrome c family protein